MLGGGGGLDAQERAEVLQLVMGEKLRKKGTWEVPDVILTGVG